MAIRHFGPRPWIREERERLAALRFDRIKVLPVGPTIGAEIADVNLASLDEKTFSEIARAFVEFKVVFFRDQNISVQAHLDFCRRFGELEEHPFLPTPEGEERIVRFAKNDAAVGVENVWHSDVTWRQIPSLGSALRAIEVPEVGGDTMFADMEAAYAGLDEVLKQRISNARAVHDFSHTFGRGMGKKELAANQLKYPPATHPVVRTHPVSGRKSIYVNAIFTSHLAGFDPEESRQLLDRLYEQATIPEYQCRFRWRPGSIAFWDNRSVQHYACSDYDPQVRVMDRVTVIGDRPV